MPYYAQRAATTTPRGPWLADHQYEVGDLVTLSGSMWYAASRNINDPPPSRVWWGPFLLGGIPGLGGGHIIRNAADEDFPERTYLRFTRSGWEEGDPEWLTVTDGAGETVVKYDTTPITPELLQDTIGHGYDLIDIPLSTVAVQPDELVLIDGPGNFTHPDPEADPPVTAKMGMDNFGIVHFQGKIIAATASPTPGSDLLVCTLPKGLLPFGRSSIRLPIWVDSVTPHAPPHLRIQGDGDVYIEIADAGDIVHLDGVRYVAGLGGRRIARDNEFFTPEDPEAFSVGSSFGEYGNLRRATGYGVVNTRVGRHPWDSDNPALSGGPYVGFPAFVRNGRTMPGVGGWAWSGEAETQYVGWEITDGPDQGLSFGPEPISFGWVPHYNQDDYPWPMYGMQDWNPALFVSDQVMVPKPFPYDSIDNNVWVYLKTAPLNPGNVFRVYIDMEVSWHDYYWDPDWDSWHPGGDDT